MKTRRLLVVLTSLALLLSATASGTLAAKPASVGIKATQKVKHLGTTRLSGSAGKVTDPGKLGGEVRPDPDSAAGGADRQTPKNAQGAARVPSSHVPRPAVQNIVDATGSTFHFGGLTHYDQRAAGTGVYANTQFSLEPPDQGLCASTTTVVETINTAIRVRDTSGGTVQAAMPLNDFFNLAPEFDRVNGVYGDFSSDPKCYYDSPTDRWFVSLLQLSIDPASGDFSGRSHLLLAASQTGDPTGAWNLFSIDVTNDGANGTPNHAGCDTGCFGDQPLIGADANGFYVTTNEYPIFTAGFNGANVYAFSKAGLESNTIASATTFFEPTLAEGQAYSLQPSTTPPGASSATENNGTEYFLSALEFTGGLDNRIALWAVTNTASLATTPDLSIQVKVLGSEVYGLPASAMEQRAGSTPLRDLIKSKLAPSVLGVKSASLPISFINANDDRMNQSVYVGGQVWGALNTRVKGPTGPIRTGIAWFDVAPSWSAGILGGSMTAQGYVAVQNDHLAFPSVAANAAGKVIVAFSLLGPDYFPSSAYAPLSSSTGTGSVRVVKWGVGPQDGFTGYVSLDPGDGGISRWGDYSAAVADANGNIWFATESINQSCTFAAFAADTSCGGTRTILANWGTTIAKVAP